ncbi:MAG: hypothetical protein OEQ53_14910, partial [Saprospiraceae bacterium]|nr:hypothetical protein [Saprospiraceae bacterium]
IQALVSIPYLAEIAYTIRNYIIGFLHLILIGFVSIGLITFHALQRGPFVQQKLFKIAISILLASFVTTELLLIVQGTMFWMAKGFLPYYYELLFVSSLLLPLSIFLYWLSLIRNPVYNIKN